MKFPSSLISVFLLGHIASTAVRAQAVNTVPFGSTVGVWSGHTTIRERVDSGVNERIEIWNRTWTVSPSGVVYEETTHWGFNAADGYSPTTVTLNETGRWSYWASDGGSVDRWVYGDTFSDWYLWPHNSPNGVGYGGWGRRLTAYLDVQPAPPRYSLTTRVSGSGSVSGAGTYTAGATATVTATPGGGFTFSGWQGSLSGTTNPASLTMDADQSVTAVFAAQNAAPTIAWIVAPNHAASGQSYTVTAHGHDSDGNLTQVNVWKNGAPFAFVGGGNGTDNDGGNTTSDTGPATITFTANAVDADGATSATISHPVTVTAANRAPTIAWNTTPGSVANGQVYTLSAHGHDADGNLTKVNVWRNGVGFAFAGGGNGTDGNSGNSTSDSGPATITFTANAVDAAGATSATISQTVTIAAANNAPTIAWNTSPGSVASGQSYTVSAHGHDADGNLTQVNVWKNGAAFARADGGNGTAADSGNTTSDPGPATATFVAQAVDSAGAASAPITQTVVIAAPAALSAALSVRPAEATAPASATITWASDGASAVFTSGPGLASAAASGSQPVSGLAAGTHTYTLVAQGSGGPITRTATLVVNPPPTVSGTLVADPAATLAPGHTTVTWSTRDATAVTVNGPGLASSAPSGAQTVAGLPAGTHTFTLLAQGPGGPLTRTANVTVQAPAAYALTTAAGAGGTVTPGGIYPAGTLVTLTATPDGTHRFTDWTGDVTGTAATLAVLLDRDKFAQGNFTGKTPQSIVFDPPGDHGLTSTPFVLTASASSGLPVRFALLGGPAVLTAHSLLFTGAGAVTVQANQPGDAFYLPAPPVNRSFNVMAAATLTYRGESRTRLHHAATREAPPYVLEKP